MKRILILILIACLFVAPLVSAADNKTKEDKIKVVNPSDITWKDITTKTIHVMPVAKSFTVGKTTKIIQVYHDSEISISEDAETVMQKTPSRSEVYYGYQKPTKEPWIYYCRVEGETVVYGDYRLHKLWTKPVTPEIQAALTSGDLPQWEDLQ